MSAEALASGGKVWNLNKNASSNKTGMKLHIFPLVAYVVVCLVSTFFVYHLNSDINHYEIDKGTPFSHEYVATVEGKVHLWKMYLSLALIILPAIAICFYIAKTQNMLMQRVSLLLMSVGILTGFIVGLIGLSAGATKPDPFNDWAKDTYGYTSIERAESNGNIAVYDAVNAKGEKIKVKAYDAGDGTYLYENTEQLKSVLDLAAKKVIAQEESSK